MENRAKIARDCVEIVELLKNDYELAGRDWKELEPNLNRARGLVSTVDRSLDNAIPELIKERQLAYAKASKSGNEHNSTRAKFFKAQGIWQTWCAAQHAAFGSRTSVVQCCGFAVGWFAAAKAAFDNDEIWMCLDAANTAQQEFLDRISEVKNEH